MLETVRLTHKTSGTKARCLSGTLLTAALVAGFSAQAQPSPGLPASAGQTTTSQTAALDSQATAPGTISGVVTDTDGELILGAQVTLSGSGTPRTATTDANGRFTFSAVTPGAFHLIVIASGRAADSLDGQLAPGQSFDAATLVLHASAGREY